MQLTDAISRISESVKVYELDFRVGEKRVIVNNPKFPKVGLLLALGSGGDHMWKLALKRQIEGPRPNEDWGFA